MKEIEKKKVFGNKVVHIFTIEFQKCGLPHIHILLFRQGLDKIKTCDQVDQAVYAEFPDLEDIDVLFQTIKRYILHGPCDPRNPGAPCMENGRCTKRYPRVFSEVTTIDQDGYPIYRYRNDGQTYNVNGHDVDN